MPFTPEAEGLFVAQGRVAHVDQLTAAGMSRSAVRWQLGKRLRLVLPEVVAEVDGSLTVTQRLTAAQLYTGADAVLTGCAAAAWHGVTSAAARSVIRVEVPAARRPRSTSGVVVRRTWRPDPQPWRRAPLVLASRERSVVQAARDSSPEAAVELVLEAVQRRLVTTDALRWELEAGESDGSAQVRMAIRLAEDAAWSVPEAELADVIATSRVLPSPLLNPDLWAPDGTRLPRPDAWFDDVALAVQLHSRRYHGTDDDAFDRTITSDGVYAEYGIPVVALTPRRLHDDPAAARLRLERAYAAARARPRADVRTAPAALLA